MSWRFSDFEERHKQAVFKSWKGGKTIKQVSEKLNCSEWTINRVLLSMPEYLEARKTVDHRRADQAKERAALKDLVRHAKETTNATNAEIRRMWKISDHTMRGICRELKSERRANRDYLTN